MFGNEVRSNGSSTNWGSWIRRGFIGHFDPFTQLDHYPIGLAGKLGPGKQPLADALRHSLLRH